MPGGMCATSQAGALGGILAAADESHVSISAAGGSPLLPHMLSYLADQYTSFTTLASAFWNGRLVSYAPSLGNVVATPGARSPRFTSGSHDFANAARNGLPGSLM